MQIGEDRFKSVMVPWQVEAVERRCSVNKVFLKNLQNSQQNTCARVYFLNKDSGLKPIFKKKTLWHRCFPVDIAKFLTTPIL